MTDGNFQRVKKVTPQLLKKYGHDAQIVKAIEELAELQVVLAKFLNMNSLREPLAFDAITNEIADALIMVNQMRILFGEAQVDNEIDCKLTRIEKGFENAL